MPLKINFPFLKAPTLLILGGGIVCATTVLKLIAMLMPCEYDDKMCEIGNEAQNVHILSSYIQGVNIAIILRTVVEQTILSAKMRNVVALKKIIFKNNLFSCPHTY